MPLGANKLGMQQFNTLVTYVSGAVEFDADNDEGYSIVCNDADYDDAATKGTTGASGMSVWIKPATITSGTIFEYSFTDTEAGALDHYPIWRLRLANTGALIFEGSQDNFQSNHTSQNLYKFTTGNNVITANEWNHIAFRIDTNYLFSQPAKLQLFVNGQQTTATVNSDPTAPGIMDRFGWEGDKSGNDGNFSNFRISVGCQSRVGESPDFVDHYDGQITQLWVGVMPDLVQSHQIAVGSDSTSSSTTEAGIRLFYDGGIVDLGENGQLPTRLFNPTAFSTDSNPANFNNMLPPRFYFSGDTSTFVKNRANRTATITDISKADPAVVTVSAGHLIDTDITTEIKIQDVNGFEVASTPVSNPTNDSFRAEWQSATTLRLLSRSNSSQGYFINNFRFDTTYTPGPGFTSGKDDYVSGGTIKFRIPGANCNDLASTDTGINAPSSVTGILNLPNKYIT